MFLTSQERKSMNNRGSSDSERQNLLDRLLDAVKQCQVRFGGKTELATDTDSRVTCLLAQLLAIFDHGLKKPKGTVRAFMQVGQVAGITKQGELEPAFYTFIKEHLSKNEQERFTGLHNITTDAGRGRAWLRSTLNEHTLERNIHNILGDKQLLSLYYEPEAFLLDEEKASMLPMIAAGVSSILFALGIDKEELNTVKQVSPQLPSTKEVFSNLLSFPAAKPKPEPVAIVSENTQQKDTKKKKKKKKKSALIATIDDGDSSNQGSTEELNFSNQNLYDPKDFPFSDASTFHSKLSKTTTKQGHSRSSSYPGKIKLENEALDQNAGTSLPKSDGFGFGHQRIVREISLSDTILTEESNSDIKWTENSEESERSSNSNLTKGALLDQDVDTTEEKDEQQGKELNTSRTSSSLGIQGNMVVMETYSKIGNFNRVSNVETGNAFLDCSNKETNCSETDFSNNGIKEEEFLSVRSFRHSKPGQNTITSDLEKRQLFDKSDLSNQEISFSSVSKEDESFLVMGGDDGLMPLVEHQSHKSEDSLTNKVEVQGNQDSVEEKEDRESSKDSVSLSSNSWFDENDDRTDQSEDDVLRRLRSDSLSAATDAAAAALEFCTPSNTDQLSSVSSNVGDNSSVTNELAAQQEGMTTSELKQAIVSMMLRKDEIEDQNRVLRQLVEEKRHEKEVIEAQMDRANQENKAREDQDAAKITALTRENEVLKHQLKKYVGAVQMLRSNMHDTNSVNLQGIRQDEVLPTLPERENVQNIDSQNEANEYERKLIQVAEMHGELMEFNERLQRQLNYWQIQSKRQQEELVSLRGPLPEDGSVDSSGLSDIDVNIVKNRPLINIWIPSVFLKGKGPAGVHHLYQVYIRIKDDEWNVYRRYSQFYDLHKKICKKHKIAESFKFPSKKTFGNRGTKFVEERRKVLQEYIRHVVNLIISTQPELATNTCKATLLDIMPFFGDPFPNENKTSRHPRKNTEPYDGL